MPIARKSSLLTWLDLCPPLYVKLSADLKSADGTTVYAAGTNVTARAVDRNDDVVMIWTSDKPIPLICSLRELKRGTSHV